MPAFGAGVAIVRLQGGVWAVFIWIGQFWLPLPNVLLPIDLRGRGLRGSWGFPPGSVWPLVATKGQLTWGVNLWGALSGDP